MTTTASAPATAATVTDLLISSDSHVIEDTELWTSRVAPAFKDRAPTFPPRQAGEAFSAHDGGWDPMARLKEMAVDGVSAEVLYPSLALTLFGQEEAALQEECFRVYNDWLIEYCQAALDRLVGIACISVYNIDNAVKELERCRDAGLRGALVWQAPHKDIPFTSDHYERLWAAAQDMDMPISLHILTGHGYAKKIFEMQGVEIYRNSVNTKLYEAANAMFDLIFYGALDRFPRLKFVIVENEIGWMPFVVEQWDRYYKRFQKQNPTVANLLPSEYFERQMNATFFNDPSGGHALARWGHNNCMWSNDFPHPNSTWPNSRDVIARDLGHLDGPLRKKILSENVARLYGMNVAALV